MAFSFTIGDPSRIRGQAGPPSEVLTSVRPTSRDSSTNSACQWSCETGEEEESWEDVLAKAKEAPPPEPLKADQSPASKTSRDTWEDRAQRRTHRNASRENKYAEWEAWIRQAWNSAPDDPEQVPPPLPAATDYDLHPPEYQLQATQTLSEPRESRAAVARREANADRSRGVAARTQAQPDSLASQMSMFRPVIRDDSPESSSPRTSKPRTRSPPKTHKMSTMGGGEGPVLPMPIGHGFQAAWRSESRLLPPPMTPLPLPPAARPGRLITPLLIDLRPSSAANDADANTADLLGLNLPPPPSSGLSSKPLMSDPFDMLDAHGA